MYLNKNFSLRLIAFGAFNLVLFVSLAATTSAQTRPAATPPPPSSAAPKPAGPQLAPEEQAAAMKVQNATDVAAALTAANEYLQKYAKSPLRPKVAQIVALKIDAVTDAAQQIAFAEQYLTAFNEPTEADYIHPTLVDAYRIANRLDDAFAIAAKMIQKNPNDLITLTQTTIIAADQLKRQNGKYAQQALDYGPKAIQIIEGGTKPLNLSDEQWNEYKTKWLPMLYQSLGLISYATGQKAEAKAKLDKAAALSGNDVITFLLLGQLADDEYTQLATQHKAAANGPAKDELLKKAQTQMDIVIDLFAHTIALAETDPQYKALHDQLMQTLEAYYKYRHNNKTDGMQDLIGKYKKQ